MSATLIISFVGYLLLIAYLFWVQATFSEQSSLSDTYYKIRERKKSYGVLYSTAIAVSALTLIPRGLDLTEGSWYQFVAFLTPLGYFTTSILPTRLPQEKSWINTVILFISAVLYTLILHQWVAVIVCSLIWSPILIYSNRRRFILDMLSLCLIYSSLF